MREGRLREGGERARGGREEAMTLGRQRASVDEGRVERGGGREGARERGSERGNEGVREGRLREGEGESKGREGGSHEARQAESVSG